MKFKLVYDTHIGSPIEICRDEVFHLLANENTILGGDIIDGANCAKSEVEKYKEFHLQLTGTHGRNYIDGNHERFTTIDEFIIRTNEEGECIIFVHGDIQANPDKWRAYRNQSWGASIFKRKFVVPFIREAEQIINRTPKQDFIDRAVALAKLHSCNKFVCGHFHPEKMINFTAEGIEIYIMPRGITDIDL